MCQGQLISPFQCQLTLHGLPPSLARQGLGHQLLSGAGYSSQESTVEGEFMKDLPSQFASQRAAAGIGNADACLYSSGHLLGTSSSHACRRSFCLGGEDTHLSAWPERPNHTSHTAAADSQVVTHREGPRSIRIRQKERAVSGQRSLCHRVSWSQDR